jgi:lysophospholipase L1-like esterase
MKRKTLFYWFFIALFTFGAAELAAHYYLTEILHKSTDKKFRFNSYRVYEQVPGFREGDGTKDWIVINNQGFRRENDVTREKPDDTFRAFFLGGSAAAGVSSAAPYPIEHVHMDETIDAHLEVMLQDAFPDKKIEIINAAVTGYKVFQHTAYLLSELLDYDPDLIIFMDGANDHYRHNPHLDMYGDFKYQYWKPRLQEPSLGGMFDYVANYMANYSALFRGYVAWNLQRDAIKISRSAPHNYKATSDQEVIEGYHTVAPKEYLRSIQTNLDILKRHDIDAVLALQPALPLRDKEKLSDKEISFSRQNNISRLLYPEIVKDLDEIAALNQVDWVDLVSPFNDPKYAKQQLLIDYAHVNSAGGKLIAESLFPVVKPKVEDFFTPSNVEGE